MGAAVAVTVLEAHTDACELSEEVRNVVPVPDVDRDSDADPLSVDAVVGVAHPEGGADRDDTADVLAVREATAEKVGALDADTVSDMVADAHALLLGETEELSQRVARNDAVATPVLLAVLDGVVQTVTEGDDDPEGDFDTCALRDAELLRLGNDDEEVLRGTLGDDVGVVSALAVRDALGRSDVDAAADAEGDRVGLGDADAQRLALMQEDALEEPQGAKVSDPLNVAADGVAPRELDACDDTDADSDGALSIDLDGDCVREALAHALLDVKPVADWLRFEADESADRDPERLALGLRDDVGDRDGLKVADAERDTDGDAEGERDKAGERDGRSEREAALE